MRNMHSAQCGLPLLNNKSSCMVALQGTHALLCVGLNSPHSCWHARVQLPSSLGQRSGITHAAVDHDPLPACNAAKGPINCCTSAAALQHQKWVPTRANTSPLCGASFAACMATAVAFAVLQEAWHVACGMHGKAWCAAPTVLLGHRSKDVSHYRRLHGRSRINDQHPARAILIHRCMHLWEGRQTVLWVQPVAWQTCGFARRLHRTAGQATAMATGVHMGKGQYSKTARPLLLL